MRQGQALYAGLLAIAVVCSAATAFGVMGVLVGAILLAALEGIRHAQTLFKAFNIAIITLLIFVFLLVGLMAFMSEHRECSRRGQCENNMRQLAMSLLGYYEQYRHFPPAYIADKDGKPIHSWRVLLLPYIGRKDIYEKYDFNEPWDGPNNRKLSDSCPSIYKCPSDEGDCKNGATASYFAVAGRGPLD